LQYWKRFRRTDARNVDVIDLSLLISKTADKMFSVIKPSDYCGVQAAGLSRGFILNTLLECIFRGYVKAFSHKINNINELHKPEITIIIKKNLARWKRERRERGGL
jgi:hypothetical protein